MKKNRIIAAIWIGIIVVIIVAVIIYLCYAAKYNPYFGLSE